ncbi:uncharacterized protein KD926_008682 [Aspergillus affinis]|uniref:uncharacterized protein n=1 Tax=Aspergillus affinis TaxID=1070780 RepID=UPI0022FECBF0|nr:uncharacterized protein KD926_008682 [Aspergillus affinis]KAI9039991.1 hypothetical protein KD926_008682 [Aspergillus affinis]
MSAYFEPEELRFILEQLARDPHTEEFRSKRFRETYSPFNPAHHDHRGGGYDDKGREVRMSEISETPRSARKPTPLPTMASGQEPSTPYPVGAGGAGKNRALATCNVEQIGQIGICERIKHWRRSSCHWPFPNAPVAEGVRYAASVDQLEFLTEIATSNSGSINGDCIHVNGDIEIHGARISPGSQQPILHPPAKKTRGGKAQKRKNKNFTSGPPPKNGEEKSLPGQSDEINQAINAKDFFFSKRRRSARIAALTKAKK